MNPTRFSTPLLCLGLLAVSAGAMAQTDIACRAGENAKVVVGEPDATVEFVVRNAAAGACWCGPRAPVTVQADRLYGVLYGIELSGRFDPGDAVLKAAYANGTGALQQFVIDRLGLAQDYSFTVDLPPGVGQRSDEAACFSDSELQRFVQNVGRFLDATISP